MVRHFLKDDDITAAEQAEILSRAISLKKNPYSKIPLESLGVRLLKLFGVPMLRQVLKKWPSTLKFRLLTP
jgi:ornithine carbamoyltransferase